MVPHTQGLEHLHPKRHHKVEMTKKVSRCQSRLEDTQSNQTTVDDITSGVDRLTVTPPPGTSQARGAFTFHSPSIKPMKQPARASRNRLYKSPEVRTVEPEETDEEEITPWLRGGLATVATSRSSLYLNSEVLYSFGYLLTIDRSLSQDDESQFNASAIVC